MNRQKGSIIITVLVVVVLSLLGIGTIYYGVKVSQNKPLSPKPEAQKACTLEAKICPDGSSVGRTGPNCEFAACPASLTTLDWKVNTNNKYGYTISYPSYLSHEYTEVDGGATDRYYSGESRIAGGYTGDHIVISITDVRDFAPEPVDTTKKTTLVAGQTVQVIEDNAVKLIQVRSVVHKGYKFDFSYMPPEINPHPEDFYKVLESFKLTD